MTPLIKKTSATATATATETTRTPITTMKEEKLHSYKNKIIQESLPKTSFESERHTYVEEAMINDKMVPNHSTIFSFLLKIRMM